MGEQAFEGKQLAPDPDRFPIQRHRREVYPRVSHRVLHKCEIEHGKDPRVAVGLPNLARPRCQFVHRMTRNLLSKRDMGVIGERFFVVNHATVKRLVQFHQPVPAHSKLDVDHVRYGEHSDIRDVQVERRNSFRVLLDVPGSFLRRGLNRSWGKESDMCVRVTRRY